MVFIYLFICNLVLDIFSISSLLTLISNEERRKNPLSTENGKHFYMRLPEISFLDELVYPTITLWVKKQLYLIILYVYFPFNY